MKLTSKDKKSKKFNWIKCYCGQEIGIAKKMPLKVSIGEIFCKCGRKLY